MPSNPRSKLKKKAAGVLNHWDRSLILLDDLYETFNPQHPDYGDYIAGIITNLLLCREFMLDFWGKAWGEVPDDYQKWL